MSRPTGFHAVVLALAVQLSAQVPKSSVSDFRANLQHTGAYDAPGVAELRGLVWKSEVEGRGQNPPAIADGVLCVGRSVYSGLVALDIQTGKSLWVFPTGRFLASPAIADRLVYASYIDEDLKRGGLRALDLRTGKTRWNFATSKDEHTSPAVSGGVVYMVSWDGNLYALDAKTGQEKWRFPYAEGGQTASTSPVIDDDTLYFGGGGFVIGASAGRGQKDVFCGLFAVDLKTGREKWRKAYPRDPKRPGGGNLEILDSPAVVDGTIYFGTGSQTMCAADAGNGAIKWRYESGSYRVTAPAVGPEMVYFGSQDGFLYALNRTTGGEVWKSSGFWYAGQPSLARGILYCSGKDSPGQTADSNHVSHIYLYAMDARNGQVKWKYEPDQPHLGRPDSERWERWNPSAAVIVDDSVYFTCRTSAYRLH